MFGRNRPTEGNSQRIRVGITHGDINGIGYELILKTFADNRMLDEFIPIIYGSAKVASYHKKLLSSGEINFNQIKYSSQANPKRVNIVNVVNQEVRIDIGKSTSQAGELSFLALEAAVKDLKQNSIDVLVTCPINKHNIQSESFEFPGHTEYLAGKFESKDALMLMVSNVMKIGVVTGHIPLKDVSASLNSELIENKLRIMGETLKSDFQCRKPRIAVLGLNPHAGDNGLLGDEEQNIITPAINNAKKEGLLVFGPYPADGFFASGDFTRFDAILAMYHDQGLIAFKSLAYDMGVNFTAGLPIVRTSPAHGTAYEIAGKDKASIESFRQSLFLARDIFLNRTEYKELSSQPVADHLSEVLASHENNNSRKGPFSEQQPA